jgi:hypothetical protein
LKINLRIEFLSGESKEVTASAADLVAFEDKFNLSVTRLDQEMRLTHLLYLAWHSLSRTKQTDKDFDAWVELVDTAGASAIDPKSRG